MGNVADAIGGWQPQQQQQRSYAAAMSAALLRETRRSCMAKDKPHVCQYPGCDKSYFYLHDLRRHYKQKQHGVPGSDTDNRETEEAEECRQLEGSPPDVSELLDQSRREHGHVIKQDIPPTVYIRHTDY